MCFETASKLGDSSSKSALAMLRSSNQRKVQSEPEDFIDHDEIDSFPEKRAEKQLISALC